MDVKLSKKFFIRHLLNQLELEDADFVVEGKVLVELKSTTYDIVKAYGGEIMVESAKDKGTTSTITQAIGK